MSKKYVPSGYQIIDLGSIDLSDLPTSKTASDGEDFKILIDLAKQGKLASKPILCKYIASNSDMVCTEWGTIKGDGINLSSITISINVESEQIVIDEP